MGKRLEIPLWGHDMYSKGTHKNMLLVLMLQKSFCADIGLKRSWKAQICEILKWDNSLHTHREKWPEWGAMSNWSDWGKKQATIKWQCICWSLNLYTTFDSSMIFKLHSQH
jgi:hypothetical protein